MEHIMAFSRTAAHVYADGPSGLPTHPPKSEIRPLLKQYENSISALMISTNAAVVKGERSELVAVVGDFANGDVGLVIFDATEAYRGGYKKVSGSWVKQSDLPSDVAQIAADMSIDARDTAVTNAAAALISQAAALASEAAAHTSELNATAAAEASGPARFFDTKALADAAVAGLPANQVVEVFTDETHGSARTRYVKESGSLVFKRIIGMWVGDRFLPSLASSSLSTIQDILELIASPHLFGGKGDGLNDDTAAINACLAAYGSCTLRSGKTYLISSPVLISADNQVLNISDNAVLKVSASFTGNEAVKVSNSSGSVIVSRFKITGFGTIDCNLNTATGAGIAYGINVVFARWGCIESVNIKGAKTKPVWVGSHASNVSYEVHSLNWKAILHEVQTGTPYKNESGSIGCHYDRCTDSFILNVVPVGYRVGMRHEQGSIFYNACHVWTRVAFHGSMTHGFYFNGSGFVASECYADTPVDGTNEVYGFYVNKKIGRIIAPKVYNNPSFGVDGTLIGIYFAQGASGTKVVAPHFTSSENPSFRFKAYYGGTDWSFLDSVEITGVQHDGMVVDFSTARDFGVRQGKSLRRVYDDFNGVAVDSSRWASLAGTAGGAASVSEQAGGFLRLATGNNSAADMAANGIQLSGGLSWRPSDGKIRALFSAKISSANTVAVAIGFTDQRGSLEFPATISGGSIVSNASNAAIWVFDTGQTASPAVWQALAVNGNTDSALQTSTLANSSTVPRPMEIEISVSGDVIFRIGGVQVGATLTAAVDPTAPLCFVAAAFSRINSVRNIDVDYITVEQELT
jgi:hypothetical protein